ncbi:MAG: MFS transporter [Pseudomonadota bacterium]
MATTADTMPGAASAAPEDKLPVALKLGWATGAFGIALLMNGIAGVLLLFAVSMLGIDPWLAGAIITVSKLFDAVTDPIVGMWSDRLRSAKGRRRPFLTWGAVLSAASFAIIFTTPQFANQYATAAYLFGALCLYAFGYTLFNIPYMSMPAEMTDSYHERSSIHAYRMVFVALGGLVAGAGVKFALDVLGQTEKSSWAIVGTACAALIFVSLMIAYISTANARFTDPSEDTGQNKFEQLQLEFGAVVGNGHFLRLIGVKFSQLMGVQTMGAAMAYFFVQYLQQSFSVLAMFFLVVSLSSIVFSPLLVMFSKAYGKKAAYYVAAAVNIAYALSWTVSGPDDPVALILARGLLVGVAFAGNVIMAMSMLTDIINEDAGRTGVRREGAFTALYSFVEKLTGAFGPLIVGVALSFVGFNKDLPFDVPQGGNVDTALLLAVSWLPAIFYIIAVALLSGYSLTQDDIEKGKVEKGL